MQPLAERLRPRTLDEYIGQKHLVGPGAVLRKMIDAGRISSFILWGPPGVGKTTLAQIIANKLETPFYTLSAVTSGVKDVREVIDRAKSNRFFSQSSPILFIDEIDRFSKSQQDSLLGAVENGTVTLIGATTRAGQLSSPLRDRFGVIQRLELYTTEQLTDIVRRSSMILEIPCTFEGAAEIASRARGTPRIANRLLKRVRDFADVMGNGEITLDIAKIALGRLEIDELGLDSNDRRMLTMMIKGYGGGPVGLETLASALGEEAVTLEDVCEPYLMQLGFLSRTPRGRCATALAYEHMGFPLPEQRKAPIQGQMTLSEAEADAAEQK